MRKMLFGMQTKMKMALVQRSFVIQSCLRPDELDRGGDCDDNDPSVLGVDEECDETMGSIGNGEIDETGSNIWYIDFDGDGSKQ